MHPTRFVFLLLLVGCGAETGGSATGRATTAVAAATRDSAGITIDEYAADIFGRAPLIGFDTVPFLRIGGDNDSLDLSVGGDVVLLGDGRTATLDREATQILVFGSDGELVTTLGKAGEGPGEFRKVNRFFVVPGDSIVAADVTPRVAIFTVEGGLARSFTIPVVYEFPTQHAISGRADGSHWFFAPLWTASNGPPEYAASSATPVSIGRVAESAGVGGSWDTVGAVMPSPQVVVTTKINGEDRELSMTPQFSAAPSVTPLGAGGVAVARGDHWDVRFYGAAGLERIVRAPIARVPVTQTMVDRVITRRMASLRESRPDFPDSVYAQTEAMLRGQPAADSIPQIVSLHATRSEMIWVIDWSEPGTDTLRATAVSPSRGVVGRLVMPTRGRVAAFDVDRVMFRETDPETGLVTLVAYRLILP